MKVEVHPINDSEKAVSMINSVKLLLIDHADRFLAVIDRMYLHFHRREDLDQYFRTSWRRQRSLSKTVYFVEGPCGALPLTSVIRMVTAVTRPTMSPSVG